MPTSSLLEMLPPPDPGLLQVCLHLPRALRLSEGSGEYYVLDWGCVVSTARPGGRAKRTPHCAPKLLKAAPHYRTGHLRVALWATGGRTRAYLHRLVCVAFHGPPPEGMEALVLHADGNPQNNRPENLRWGSRIENAADYKQHQQARRRTEEETQEYPAYTPNPEYGF